ncbi:hypothetical protein ACFWSF_11670 [Streptomyces sp. NPDC058611]|uniref:hypothetical protein n=1 Tax=unclassified Streptomyces TaxID=2593676 RepID=UPI00365CE8B6
MIFTVLLVPPLLLCVMLALGRYEEHMFDPDRLQPAPPLRHLTPVPEAETETAGETAPAPPAPPAAPVVPGSQAA